MWIWFTIILVIIWIAVCLIFILSLVPRIQQLEKHIIKYMITPRIFKLEKKVKRLEKELNIKDEEDEKTE